MTTAQTSSLPPTPVQTPDQLDFQKQVFAFQAKANDTQQSLQAQRDVFNHREAMSKEWASPATLISVALVIACVVIHLIRKHIAASIEIAKIQAQRDVETSKGDYKFLTDKFQKILDAVEEISEQLKDDE